MLKRDKEMIVKRYPIPDYVLVSSMLRIHSFSKCFNVSKGLSSWGFEKLRFHSSRHRGKYSRHSSSFQSVLNWIMGIFQSSVVAITFVMFIWYDISLINTTLESQMTSRLFVRVFIFRLICLLKSAVFTGKGFLKFISWNSNGSTKVFYWLCLRGDCKNTGMLLLYN